MERHSKIRVLSVISNLEVGGTEMQLRSLAQHLDRRIFELEICCIGSGRLTDCFADVGIRVTILGKRAHAIGVRATWRLYQLLRAFRPDIVHCQDYGAGVRAHLPTKLIGCPVLIKSYHGLNSWKRGILLQIDRFLSASTDKFVVVSQARRRILLERELVPLSRSTVIYNGVDCKRFALAFDPAARRKKKVELGLDPNKCCVGTVGSLKPVKNHEMLVRAAAILKDSNPNIDFAIVGAGPLLSSLVNQRDELGLHNDIHFLGMRDDIPEVLQAFDIFVMCSRSEDLSVAILEAMSAGLPVVATDVGGNGELVSEGLTGFLVERNSTRKFAKRVMRLARDQELRARMGVAAAERARDRFTSEVNARKTAELYRRLLLLKTGKRLPARSRGLKRSRVGAKSDG